MKTTAKLIIAAAASLALLTACGNKPEEKGNPSIPDDFLVSTEENTPNKVVGHYDPNSTVTKAPEDDSAQSDDTAASTAPTDTDEPSGDPDSPAPAQTEPEDNLPDTEAIKYLKILNSKHVHAKLTHMYSFDGDELMSIEREFYIDGDKKIYINDGNKTFMQDGMVTYVDYDSEVYCTYPNDLENGVEFGFELDKYVLISRESGEDSHSELYSINGERIASTWEFLSDDRIKVSDRDLDSPSFDYYIFELIDDGKFKMDFTIPNNFTEVNAEEYGLGN